MPQEILYTASAVLTSLGVIIGALYAIFRVTRRITDAIGVDRDGRSLSERLDRVEHQLWENGGSSLADRVNIIETHVIRTTSKLELIETLVTGPSNASCDGCAPAPIKPARKTRLKKVS